MGWDLNVKGVTKKLLEECLSKWFQCRQKFLKQDIKNRIYAITLLGIFNRNVYVFCQLIYTVHGSTTHDSLKLEKEIFVNSRVGEYILSYSDNWILYSRRVHEANYEARHKSTFYMVPYVGFKNRQN